ncbi:uncharacterized protein BX664DRAFT_337802 [Halteromyces radiatus]|uniref:uncharacterized protein n=1 Tax=Halteromyces radiatus TaxID=101107 RepID=UPI00221E4008|nr:uncharacterized protein BX664DRAFT_337802 [Halteromyces radiatus]KAI8084793.1 hypothetical protein BX664DRAFT_337802 [Halteromyces radiatus]
MDKASQAAKLEKLKRSLAHVSFEQLAEIKSKMGMKDFKLARQDNNDNDDSDDNQDDPTSRHNNKKVSKAQIIQDIKNAASKLKGTRNRMKKEDMKRTNKHSPMEMSSKRKVSRFRDVVETAATKRRDPRFDKLSGQLNEDLFEKSYGFLTDYRQDEQKALMARLHKVKDPEEKARIKATLTSMKSKEMAAADMKRKQALARERKKVEADLVKQGKQPYFLKKSEKRKLELVDKYNQLGEKRMDRILEKRRKKNANKDHKRVPFKRRST